MVVTVEVLVSLQQQRWVGDEGKGLGDGGGSRVLRACESGSGGGLRTTETTSTFLCCGACASLLPSVTLSPALYSGPLVVATDNILIVKMRFLFGDVFSLQLAWKPVIVLNGLAPVREALVNHSEYTSDRPWMSIYDHGVIMVAYGPAWCEQQHFSVSTMCNFGLGKRSLEQWVTEEASCLCTAFANEACR
ncbi:Hypothetical predicted protein [Marmota monax]|uniref:Uncharacterized protein n=1 Tax=Marmota monax TaxID=9995 RepID=A0A5E4AKU2_MARMO|nr:Hypothetical predicted protein [Marmota monax]